MKSAQRSRPKLLLFISLLSLAVAAAIDLPQPQLWMWKLSIVSVELGHWLALAPLAICLRLIFRPRADRLSFVRRLLIFAIAAGAIHLFERPLASAYRREAQWRTDLKAAFGPGRGADDAWLSPAALLFGAQDAPAPFQTFVYAQPGGVDLKLDYYPPAGGIGPATKRTLAPWVLVIHGGSWASGDRAQLAPFNSHLAREGYGVVAIDYRLAPQHPWPAQLVDARAAVAFVQSHAAEWHLDGAKWAALGRSAGAQIAGVLAYTHALDGPKGLISFYSPTDLIFGYEVGEEDDALHSRQTLRDFLGGSPYRAWAGYESASVLGALPKNPCPTLLFHGFMDTLVWHKHSERLFERLKMAGARAQLIEFDYGPHGFDYLGGGPEAQIASHAIDAFLDRVMDLPRDLRL